MSRTELGVALGTAILAFVGALLGVYVGSRLDQSNWEARFQLEQQKIILERRVSLMERTVALFNRAPTVTGLRASLDAEKKMAELDLYCALQQAKGRKPKNCAKDGKRDPERVEKIGKEIHALNAEFSSAMVLASIYFGDETRAAIKQLGADPWEAGPRKNQHLIDAMGRELRYFPK